ncbi:MAG TPA: isocitrate lyase/phosphoenolpyruvate mutase family protein [Caulobacteraceae bacterium]|jgi:2-methylisocitrate lyase-like PEP mutase family enzyme
MTSLADRRARFRALHQSGCFAIPNPWDGGTAQRLAKAGFEALASTSAGAAWTLGKADGEMSLDEVLEHLRFLVNVTDLPVNADFEAGFADTADGVAANVARCVETGVAGLSIEDKDPRTGGFFTREEAVARVRAARAAIDHSGQDVMLVGRCEAYLMKALDIEEVIARLNAYAEAGADVLYAPGIKTLEPTAEIVRRTSRPVNANLTATGLSVQDFAKAGVRRVSVGGAMARATYDAFDGFARLLAEDGKLP